MKSRHLDTLKRERYYVKIMPQFHVAQISRSEAWLSPTSPEDTKSIKSLYVQKKYHELSINGKLPLPRGKVLCS
jgi:hypothetical protein